MVCFIARVVSYMKTADILHCHHLFLARKMLCEDLMQKFHADDLSLP